VVGPPNEAAGIGDRLEITQLAQIHVNAWHGLMYHTREAGCIPQGGKTGYQRAMA